MMINFNSNYQNFDLNRWISSAVDLQLNLFMKNSINQQSKYQMPYSTDLQSKYWKPNSIELKNQIVDLMNFINYFRTNQIDCYLRNSIDCYLRNQINSYLKNSIGLHLYFKFDYFANFMTRLMFDLYYQITINYCFETDQWNRSINSLFNSG